jgi:hypothetical protein
LTPGGELFVRVFFILFIISSLLVIVEGR